MNVAMSTATEAGTKPVTTTSRSTRSIKSTLIEPFTQIKLGIYIIILSCVFLALSGWLFYHSFSEQYSHVMEIFSVTEAGSRWEVMTNDVFYSNLYKLGALFTLYIIALLAIIFRTTHKYHGPLVSIERFAQSMVEGKYYSRVAVRKHDELKELASRLNKMAMALEKKHGSLVDSSGQSMKRRQADRGL